MFQFKFYKQVPCPEDFLIFPEKTCFVKYVEWHGGERKALKQLELRLKVEEDAFASGTYLPSHANVDLLGPPTSFSGVFRFGCLSVRKFYYSVHDKFKEVRDKMAFNIPSGNHITSQLIWREYFYVMSTNNIKYGEMKDNPICLNISWAKPNEEDILKWKEGKTGIPIIDAAMRQLLVFSFTSQVEQTF